MYPVLIAAITDCAVLVLPHSTSRSVNPYPPRNNKKKKNDVSSAIAQSARPLRPSDGRKSDLLEHYGRKSHRYQRYPLHSREEWLVGNVRAKERLPLECAAGEEVRSRKP
jgi:hypothetical protein